MYPLELPSSHQSWLISGKTFSFLIPGMFYNLLGSEISAFTYLVCQMLNANNFMHCQKYSLISYGCARTEKQSLSEFVHLGKVFFQALS